MLRKRKQESNNIKWITKDIQFARYLIHCVWMEGWGWLGAQLLIEVEVDEWEGSPNDFRWRNRIKMNNNNKDYL